MNAIVYLRISQDRAGQEAGVDRQREACLRRCEERGWSVLTVEQDNDLSAAGKRKRPGFEAMLASITEGRVRHVVAWSLDRLQRNRRDELRLYEACKAQNVTLALVNGPELDFSTATGRLVADQLGSLARYEIELKSDRQVAAQSQTARKGERSGGRRPFGFEQDGMTVREAEARAIREGYADVLAGESLGGVARKWNAAGLKPEQSEAWTRLGVRTVLMNPRNAGQRAYRGEIVAEAKWPPLVDAATFEAAKAVLTDPRRARKPNAARRMLTGIAICGICGAHAHAGGSARQGVGVYRCSGSTGHFSRMADPVDDYVGRLAVGRLSMPDASTLVADRSHPDTNELRAEQDGIRERLAQLVTGFTDGVLTAEQLRIGTDRLRSRDAAIDAELADAGRVDILGELVGQEDVQVVWDGLSVARRRRVVDTLMIVTLHPPGRGTRTFRPETIGIEWRQS